ncbi:nephrocystin-4, partial [Thraustotheca clavata]
MEDDSVHAIDKEAEKHEKEGVKEAKTSEEVKTSSEATHVKEGGEKKPPVERKKSMIPRKNPSTASPATSGKDDAPKPWKKQISKTTGSAKASPAGSEKEGASDTSKKPWKKAGSLKEVKLAAQKAKDNINVEDDVVVMQPRSQSISKADTQKSEPAKQNEIVEKDIAQNVIEKKDNTKDKVSTDVAEELKVPSKAAREQEIPKKKEATEPILATRDKKQPEVIVQEPKDHSKASGDAESNSSKQSEPIVKESKREPDANDKNAPKPVDATVVSIATKDEGKKSQAPDVESKANPVATSQPDKQVKVADTNPSKAASISNVNEKQVTQEASPVKKAKKTSPQKKTKQTKREEPTKAKARKSSESSDDAEAMRQWQPPSKRIMPKQKAKRKSGSELWHEREIYFENFRSESIVMPVPDGTNSPTRVNKISAYAIDLHMVKNWPIAENLRNRSLRYGVQVTFFHSVTRRFFGNTWSSPEITESSFADITLQMSVCFLTDVVDPNCVAVVELIVHEKDTLSGLTKTSHGCGWCILPIFGQKLVGITVETLAVNIFAGSPRNLWVIDQIEWQNQAKVQGCKFLYHVRKYEPLGKLYQLLRKNEIVSGIDKIPGLKEMSLVGISPAKLDITRVKLPREISIAEEFTVTVTALRAFVHLREELEKSLIQRLAKTRKALYPLVETMEGQIATRVLKIALHNGRCFRTRQHTVPLKLENGSDTLSSVNQVVKLKGYTLSPLFAIVLVLQYTVQFRLVWPKHVKPKSEKEPLPTEDVVVITMAARSLVPSDGKKFYYHAKKKQENNDEDESLLHIELKSGSYARPYSDNVIYTSPTWTNSVKEGKLEESFASCDIEILVEGASLSSDEEAPEKEELKESNDDNNANKELLSKATKDANLSEALKTIMNPTEKPIQPKLDTIKVDPHMVTIISDDTTPSHELTRASRALLTRHGVYNELPTSPRKQGFVKPVVKSTPTTGLSINDELADKLNLFEIQFQFAAFRPISDGKVPMSMHFTFQFYDFEPTKTERLLVTGTHATTTYLLSRMEGKSKKPSPAIIFEVHTTRYSMLEPTTFVEYLRDKSLVVDVWDGDSLLFLGTMTIPLYTLMRQGSRVKKHHAEYEIQSIPTEETMVKTTYGSIQVLMSNYASTSTPCPTNAVGPLIDDANWRLSTNASDKAHCEPKHRVRARALADTNEELRNLLVKEQFYASPLTDHNKRAARKSSARDNGDATSLTRDELDLLCKRFATQVSRNNRLDADALLSLVSMPSNSKQSSNSNRPNEKNSAEFLAILRAVFVRAHAQGMHFKTMFDFLDANGDGFLTPSEFIKGLRQLGPLFASITPESLQACMAYFDTNGDGNVNYKEFLAFLHQSCCIDLRDELREVLLRAIKKGLDVPSIFRHIDTSGDGAVSYAEFEAALREMGFQVGDRATFNELCRQLDDNGDGSISYMEFITSMGLTVQAQDGLLSILQLIIQKTTTKGIDIGELFHHVDKDGSGAVSYDEFSKLIQEMDVDTQLNDKLLQQLIERIDKDKSGTIDISEFMAFAGIQYDPAVTVQRQLERILTRAAAEGISVADAFREFDKDQSGQITAKELQAALNSLHCPISNGDLKRVMKKLDSDGNGQISYKELLHFCFGSNTAEVIAKPIEQQLKTLFAEAANRGMDLAQCFGHFDKDKSKQISSTEFASALKELGFSDINAEMIDSIVAHLDKNKDGQIDFYEFIQLATPRTQAQMKKNDAAHVRLKTMLTKAIAQGVDVANAFAHFDKTNSNLVSYEDFEQALRSLGSQTWTQQDIKDILAHLDKDQSKSISLDEFRQFIGLPKTQVVPIETQFRALIAKATEQGVPLTQSFNHFDNQNHGFFTQQEFCIGMGALNFTQASKHDLTQLFTAINQDQTGEVTLKEFKTFLGYSDSSESAIIQMPPIEKLKDLFIRASDKGVNVQDAFKHFDKDGNGSISHAEFDQALAELGFTSLSTDDIAFICNTLDKDTSGEISLSEFQSLYPSSTPKATEPILPAVAESPIKQLQDFLEKAKARGVDIDASFSHFDKDGDGKITYSEFDSGMAELKFANLTSQDLSVIRKHLDTDNSGSISLAEFKQLYSKKDSNNAGASVVLEKFEICMLKAAQKGIDAWKIFKEYDEDGDNVITYAEFDAAITALDQPEILLSYLSILHKQLDKNEKGKIPLDDLKEQCFRPLVRLKILLQCAKLKNVDFEHAFTHFDTDGDGLITYEEFAKGLEALGFDGTSEDDIQDIHKSLDKDGTGTISLVEFKALYSLQQNESRKADVQNNNDVKDDQINQEAKQQKGSPMLKKQPSSKEIKTQNSSEDYQEKLRVGLLDAGKRGLDVPKVLSAFDTDGNGSIAFNDFDAALIELDIKNLVESDVVKIKQVLDPTNNSSIQLAKLLNLLSEIPSKSAESKQVSRSPSQGAVKEDAIERFQEIMRGAIKHCAEFDKVFGQYKAVNNCISMADFEIALTDLGVNSLQEAELAQVREKISQNDMISLQSLKKLFFPVVEDTPAPVATPLPSDSERVAPACLEKLCRLLSGLKSSGFNIDQAFEQYDKEGTGIISVENFSAGLQSLQLSEWSSDDTKSLSVYLDENKAGTISLLGIKKLHAKPRLVKKPSTSSRGSDSDASKRKPWQKEPTRRPSVAKPSAKTNTDTEVKSASAIPSNTTNAASTSNPAIDALKGLLQRAKEKGINIDKAFAHFDKDGNGTITYEEFDTGILELGLEKISENDIGEIKAWLDKDKSGTISLIEFKKLYAPARKPPLAKSQSSLGSSRKVVNATETKTSNTPSNESQHPPDTMKESEPAIATKPDIPKLNLERIESPVEQQKLDMKEPTKKENDTVPTTLSKRPSVVRKQTSVLAKATNPKVKAVVDIKEQPKNTPKEEPKAPVNTLPSQRSGLEETKAPVNTLPSQRSGLRPEVEYRFSPEANIRLVEMKVRQAAIAAIARGVRPNSLLTKYMENKSSEILRVHFVEFLMELGLSLIDDLGTTGYAVDAPSIMHDKVYARQLERLRQYKRSQQKNPTTRAQQELMIAASMSNSRKTEYSNQAVEEFLAQKKKMLQIVQYYREGHKKALIQNLLKDHVTTTVHIYPMFGTMVFLEVPVRSPYGHAERFRVEWSDEELQLVTDTNEWIYYREHVARAAEFPHAPSFEIEREMIDEMNEILLDGGDSVVIPFRFLSLRLRTKTRMIPIAIKSVAHGHVIAVIQLHIHPASFVCHRTYRFYHYSMAILRRCLKWLPSIDQGNQIQEKFIMCPDTNVIVETRPIERSSAPQDIFIKYRVGEYPKSGEFYLLLYDDMYHAKLNEIWRILIQSMLRLDLHATMGQGVQNELIIKGDTMPRRVSCFSSMPSELQFNPSGVFQLVPHAFNRIEVRFCTMHIRSKEIIVNLVDVDNHELVGSWLLNTTVQEPVVTKVFDVILPLGLPVLKKISYYNPWDDDRSFYLRSSDSSVMKPREQRIMLRGNGDGFLRLAFTPHSVP